MRTLSGAHRSSLEVGSGIDPIDIAECGFWTAERESQLEEICDEWQKTVPCLVIPIHGVSGGIVGHHIKPDVPRLDKKSKKPVKYDNPAGQRCRLESPPYLRGFLSASLVPLVITEGSKKGYALSSWCRQHKENFACIMLPGVWSFRKECLPDWEQVALKDRTVYIVFDSDVMTKEQVNNALRALGSFLAVRGAKVLYVELPDSTGSGKVGLDDFLVSVGHSKEAMLDVLNSASDKVPQKECPYRMKDGMTYALSFASDDGKPTEIALAHFEAWITQESRVYGAGPEAESVIYRIKLRTAFREFPESDLPASEFESLSWVHRLGGSAAIILPGAGYKDKFRCAVQMLSQPGVKRVERYTVMGWRKIDGTWTYLHAGGGLNAEGIAEGFEVEVSERMRRYSLPAPLTGSELIAALRGSLAFIGIHTPNVTWPLYLALWRSVLSRSSFSIHVNGSTGSCKTYTCLQQLKHWGPCFECEGLTRADSTAAGLEFSAHEAGDMILLVDDFKPNMDEKAIRTLSAFLQSIGDGSGKTRGNAGLKTREGKPPRGTVITTGEQEVPGGESTLARTLHVRAEPASGLVEKNKAWGKAHGNHVSGAMAAYLVHTARDLDSVREKLRMDSAAISERLAGKVDGCHPRTISAAAELLAAFGPFLDFCEQVGAVNALESQNLRNEADKYMLAMMQVQSDERRTEDPVKMALSYTDAILIAGSAHACRVDGESRPGDNYGWQLSTTSLELAYKQQGKLFAYVDEEKGFLYLIPDAWFSELRAHGTRLGTPWTLSKKELFKRLVALGIAERGGSKGREHCVRPTIGNCRPWVIKIPLSAIGRGIDFDAGNEGGMPLCPDREGVVSQLLSHIPSESGHDPFADDVLLEPDGWVTI